MTGIGEADYSARARHEDNRTRRQVQRLGVEWIALPGVGIANGVAPSIDGTFTFGTYTTGGVAIPGTGAAPIVTMPPWTDGAGTMYFFKWDVAVHEMIVTDAFGTEIANGVDLSAITSHPYRAVLSTPAATPGATSRLAGAGRITAIEFDLTSAWTASATNYWIVTARLRRMDQPNRDVLGIILGTKDLRNLSIPARTDVTLYSNDHGQEFHDSDRLVVSAAVGAGNPLPLTGFNAWARVERSIG